MILIKGTSEDVLHLAQPWSVLKAFTSRNVATWQEEDEPSKEDLWGWSYLKNGSEWNICAVGLWPKRDGHQAIGVFMIRICPFLISKDSHCRLVAGKVGSPSGQPCACAGQHRMSCEVTPHSGPRRAAVYPRDMKEKMCLCKNWSIYVCIVCIYTYIYIYVHIQ